MTLRIRHYNSRPAFHPNLPASYDFLSLWLVQNQDYQLQWILLCARDHSLLSSLRMSIAASTNFSFTDFSVPRRTPSQAPTGGQVKAHACESSRPADNGTHCSPSVRCSTHARATLCRHFTRACHRLRLTLLRTPLRQCCRTTSALRCPTSTATGSPC